MTAFDFLAPVYDALWTDSAIGQLQRAAVWRCVEPVFGAGNRVLELGCGTGADALWLASRGVCVTATDASPEMVRVARQRGVDARVLRIEDVGHLCEAFDGVFSNFGAMNCVASLADLRAPLARLVRPGGSLVLCVIGRFCLWETCWYGLRGQLRKAVRRWKGCTSSSLGADVRYPRCRDIADAFTPSFRLTQTVGIGIFVPPSYVTGIPPRILKLFSRIDARLAGWPDIRALADHRLLIFRRTCP